MAANTHFVALRESDLDLLVSRYRDCPRTTDEQRTPVQQYHVPSLPPLHEPASKRRKLAPDFFANEPSELRNPSKKWKKKKIRARDSFLKNIPGLGQWHQRQVGIIGTAAKYEAAIRALTATVDAGEESSQKQLESDNHLVREEVKLPLLTNTPLENEALKRPFSYFRALVLLSYCGLLEKAGQPYEKVDQITKYVSCFREMDRRRLRSQALRINLLIDELVKGGWTIYRATELFFISTLPEISFIRLLTSTQILCLPHTSSVLTKKASNSFSDGSQRTTM